MDCSLPGSSIHGILQARILEWVAIPFFGGSSRPRDWTGVFCHGRRILYLLRRQESPSATLTSLQQQWEKAGMEHCLQWCEGKLLQLGTAHAGKQSGIEGGIKTCANMQGLKNMLPRYLCSQNYWRMCSTKPRESPRKGKSQDPGNRRCKQDGSEEDPKTTSVFWHGGQAVQVGITIRRHTEARQLGEPGHTICLSGTGLFILMTMYIAWIS